MKNRVFDEIKDLTTEQRNPLTQDIDSLPVERILLLINDEDRRVAEIVGAEIPYIAQAVNLVVDAFKRGGRLFYVGAGTSGRLGVLDAAECPPTFGVKAEMIQGVIAGGNRALVQAQEGAEDKFDQGAKDLKSREVGPEDVVCGIAASRRTPYVIGAIEQARKAGAKTIYITCNPREEMNIPVDVAICPVVGPEVIMGSTRMKAGTATKLVLNMLTTTAMICLGKVYGNMMVDLQMTSKKLEERSKRILMLATGVSYEEAGAALKSAGGHVKTALVMILARVDSHTAQQRLQQADGFVRKAITMG
ncbi:N-acetylmuramic acid 6-phosphate etherase [bacterium]|nr:N-acetylmuramic acid 6-phosphate etherase [bacterium]